MGVDADDRLIRGADLNLTSASSMNGLVRAGSALRPQAGQIAVGGNKMTNKTPLLAACFCAAWCRTCDDYKLVFEALKVPYQELIEFLWVDIEDQSDLLDTMDIENFPTLLIADKNQVYFWGAVLPHATTVTQLLDRVISGDRLTLAAPEIFALNQRLRHFSLESLNIDPTASS